MQRMYVVGKTMCKEEGASVEVIVKGRALLFPVVNSLLYSLSFGSCPIFILHICTLEVQNFSITKEPPGELRSRTWDIAADREPRVEFSSVEVLKFGVLKCGGAQVWSSQVWRCSTCGGAQLEFWTFGFSTCGGAQLEF